MKPAHLFATIAFLIFAVWVITMSERTVRSIQGTYFSMTLPFYKVGSKSEEKIKLYLKEVQLSKTLEQRLTTTESQFESLQATQARYFQIEQENKRLREALGFKERSKFRLVSSQVLQRDPSNWWETIRIDKGEVNGIATQYPVISEYGLVGKIDRAWDDMATVLLITDESCLVSAKVEGTPAHGIISGQRGNYGEETLLRLKYLNNEIAVQSGARVLTSGQGGVFPDNIEIGTIVSIDKGTYYAEALVKPSFSLYDTDVVFTISSETEG